MGGFDLFDEGGEGRLAAEVLHLCRRLGIGIGSPPVERV